MSNSLNDRLLKAKEKLKRLEEQQRFENKKEREAISNKNKQRNIILGGIVAKHFPEVAKFEPHRNNADNEIEFKEFDLFLTLLAKDQEVITRLKEDVRIRLSPNRVGNVF
jgi:hypothetical protein